MNMVTVIIDMQEDFFSHERLQKNRHHLTSKINELAAFSRKMNIPVVWVKQEYAEDLRDAPPEIQKNNIRIVVAGTPGAEFLSELEISGADTIIVKNRYSAFFNTSLDKKLTEEKCSSIVVAGINSHACIRCSAVDAFQRDYEVILASDCIDSNDLGHHEITMNYMNEQIGKAVTNDQFFISVERA